MGLHADGGVGIFPLPDWLRRFKIVTPYARLRRRATLRPDPRSDEQPDQNACSTHDLQETACEVEHRRETSLSATHPAGMASFAERTRLVTSSDRAGKIRQHHQRRRFIFLRRQWLSDDSDAWCLRPQVRSWGQFHSPLAPNDALPTSPKRAAPVFSRSHGPPWAVRDAPASYRQGPVRGFLPQADRERPCSGADRNA